MANELKFFVDGFIKTIEKLEKKTKAIIENSFDKEEGAQQYLELLSRVKLGTKTQTQEGKFEYHTFSKINKLEKQAIEYANKSLGTIDWQRYIRIYWNPKQNKIKTMTTPYGTEVGKSKNPERIEEREKASKYWHQLQIAVYDCFKNKEEKKNETKEPDFITIISN